MNISGARIELNNVKEKKKNCERRPDVIINKNKQIPTRKKMVHLIFLCLLFLSIFGSHFFIIIFIDRL